MTVQDNDLLPPEWLIEKAGIGILDKATIHRDFDAIGRNAVSSMAKDGFIRPGMSVLDVGCGLGRFARALVEAIGPTGSYVGLDVYKPSIDWCSENYRHLPNFRFVWSDVFSSMYNPDSMYAAEFYKFPLQDDTFDAVLSTSLFTHLMIGETDNYLKEIARVLRHGGQTWNSFMLLDEVSEPLSARMLTTPVEGGRVARPWDPAALSGLNRELVERSHAVHGLRILDTRLGPWSGRREGVRAGYQDTIIAEKIARHAYLYSQTMMIPGADPCPACAV